MAGSLSSFSCPVCDGGTVRLTSLPYPVKFRDREYVVPDAEVMACEKCGEVFFAPGQSDALQRRASDLAREDMGLLAGADIAALRKRSGLTQAQFESALGAPAKSVARWEIGTVLQSRTVDRFLRVLVAHPELLAELVDPSRARVTCSPPSRQRSQYASRKRQPLIGRRPYGRTDLALAA